MNERVRTLLLDAGFIENNGTEAGFVLYHTSSEVDLLHDQSGITEDERHTKLEQYQVVLAPHFRTTITYPVLVIKRKL